MTKSSRSRTTPKQERAKLTRAVLLTAARKVFADKGYSRSTVADIVAEAERAHGTFYLYFRTKQDALIALLDDAISSLEARWLEQERDLRDAREVAATLEQLTEDFDEFADLSAVLTQMTATEPSFIALHDRWRATFVNRVRTGLGSWDQVSSAGLDPELLAEILVAMVEELSLIAHRDRASWSKVVLTYHLTAFWLRALGHSEADVRAVASAPRSVGGSKARSTRKKPSTLPKHLSLRSKERETSRSIDAGQQGRRQPERTERTRRALLTVARALFRQKGYAKTTVADITGAAGRAHGTFYLYFENKGDVFSELLDDMAHRIVTHARDDWHEVAHIDAIRLGVQRFCQEVESNADLWQLLEQMAATEESAQRMRLQLRKLFTGHIQRGLDVSIPDQLMERLDTHIMSELLMGPIFRFAWIGRLPAPPVTVAYHMTILWARGTGYQRSVITRFQREHARRVA